MRKEILQFTKMISGLAPKLGPQYRKVEFGKVMYYGEVGWEVSGYTHGKYIIDFTFRYAGGSVGSGCLHAIPLEFVEIAHSRLAKLLADIVREFPEIQEVWRPLLRAAINKK
jgi:hypothetical protein